MSAQSVIKNFMSVLDSTSKQGTAALDEAVAAVSKFKSWSELVNTMAADCTAYGSDGDGFLKDCCGIILDNNDTGAITGLDAGGGVTKTAESIVPENGSWSYPTSTSFKIQGLTVNVPEQSTLSESAQWIVGALYTWWIGESLSLIKSSYGYSFNESGTTVKELTISFYDSTDGKMAASFYSSGQKSSELQLRINLNYFGNIDTTDPNGIGSSAALNYLDRTIAHELVHAVMSANVDWYANLPTFFKEGSAELVHGIDDKRYTTIKNLSTSPSTLKSAATSGSGVNSYAAGYIALRYLAKQASEGRDPSTSITPTTPTTDDTVPADTVPADTVPAYTVPADTISTASTNFDGVTLKVSGAIDSDVFLSETNPFTGEINSLGNAAAIVLDASEMTTAHFLGGNTNNNYIIAGNAGSTTWGGAYGNDTLQGGAGIDNFWYLTGNGQDTAINFATGTAGDVMSFIGGGLAVILRDGNYLSALMTDGGSFAAVTDNATADVAINFSFDGANIFSAKVGNTNATNNFTYEGDDKIYLGGNFSDTVNVLTAGAAVNLDGGNFSSVEVLNAAFSGGANVLFGDVAANEIYSGGNGSVLWGGAGIADDILIGGTGADVFMYGANEGNDVIVNAEDDDVINFYNATLADVTFAQETEGGMLIGVGSNVLAIAGTNNTAVTFADGSSLRYNRAAKVWTNV
ncbi:MAG: hypothetical protein IKE46_02195 [Selenomonadaceae bacterium]|nr:hypothetical protein [Selenomonadaceae bacterium]